MKKIYSGPGICLMMAHYC